MYNVFSRENDDEVGIGEVDDRVSRIFRNKANSNLTLKKMHIIVIITVTSIEKAC